MEGARGRDQEGSETRSNRESETHQRERVHTSWEIQVQPERMKERIYFTFDSGLRLELVKEIGQQVN